MKAEMLSEFCYQKRNRAAMGPGRRAMLTLMLTERDDIPSLRFDVRR
jgi:hypothetical protein